MPNSFSDRGTILEVAFPGRPHEFVPVTESPFLIGRGSETGNHLQLDDRRISRRCAAIVTLEAGYKIQDLGHRLGIFVNGDKVDSKDLRDGDVIQFGLEDGCEIVFHTAAKGSTSAELNPTIPAQFDKLILKCLAKSPADRHQTGAELAQPLAEVRAGAAPASMIAAAVVLLAAVAAGGWFLLHRGSHASPPQPPPRQAATTAPQPVAQPAPPSQTAPPPVGTQKAKPAAGVKASAAVKSRAAPPAGTATAPPVAAPAPLPHPGPVTFNPKTLDPKQNARLKIDLSHFPNALAFTVEMNGKLYCKGIAGSKADYDGLYVPPGVHQFRVTVGGGSVQKASNTVSAKFIAKKHLTLKVELRPQPGGSSGALAPTTQVLATLKTDLFQF